ncbi:MAG: hypothetical protein JNM94_14305 [Phycisphaerae bacterium]|nr:hypothetical protein [Phycisphaerae bacterium]
MQNPALGAALIWRFVCGFTPNSSATGTPLPLAFIVLPIALHTRTLERVTSTKSESGLRKLEEKFSAHGDLVLAIQSRMLAMRQLSLRSVRIGLWSGLMTLVPSEGVLWPRSRAAAPPGEKATRELLKSAEKLGAWCRPLTLFEVSGILKVEF